MITSGPPTCTRETSTNMHMSICAASCVPHGGVYNGSWRGGKYLCKGLVVEMVVDEVCSRGGGNVTTRAAHMSSGTRLRCRSIARSSHGPRRAVGQQVAECQTEGGEWHATHPLRSNARWNKKGLEWSKLRAHSPVPFLL